MTRPCPCCIAFWVALLVVACFWPWLLAWLGAGIVVAVVIGATANPVPTVEIEPRHVHRPEDALR